MRSFGLVQQLTHGHADVNPLALVNVLRPVLDDSIILVEVVVIVIGDAPGVGAAQVHLPVSGIAAVRQRDVMRLQHLQPHLALQHLVEEGLRQVDAQLIDVFPHLELEFQLQVLLVQQELALVLATLKLVELSHAQVHAVLRLVHVVLKVHRVHPGTGGLAVACDDALGNLVCVPV